MRQHFCTCCFTAKTKTSNLNALNNKIFSLIQVTNSLGYTLNGDKLLFYLPLASTSRKFYLKLLSFFKMTAFSKLFSISTLFFRGFIYDFSKQCKGIFLVSCAIRETMVKD